MARSFYRDQLGSILATSPNWAAAILFYLIFIAGLLYFAVIPGVKEKALKKSLEKAWVFGLLTYGTYDLTNLALVEGWPVSVTVVDMIWGMTISVLVCFITLKVCGPLDH